MSTMTHRAGTAETVIRSIGGAAVRAIIIIRTLP